MTGRDRWVKENNIEIAMPNNMFQTLKGWVDSGEIKSNLHQEFIYSYYWLVAYLWRYAKYAQAPFTQANLKKLLGYNPNDQRLNYIIKKNGLLDKKGLTATVRDFPVEWSFNKNNELSFIMWSELPEEEQQDHNPFPSNNFQVKKPVLSTGSKNKKGLYWQMSNVHLMNLKVFMTCMENPKLGCAGFYLCGYMKMLDGKLNKGKGFYRSYQDIGETLSWSAKRSRSVVQALHEAKLIKKHQPERGQSNQYTILF